MTAAGRRPTGTLADELTESPVAGRFALIVNRPGDLSAPASYGPAWESLLGVLVSSPQGPAPSALVPR